VPEEKRGSSMGLGGGGDRQERSVLRRELRSPPPWERKGTAK
jgi:hypothetical protein